MPIRFRCRYCNQLIGIARRKVGTVVSCPTCHGQLTVPAADQAEPAGAAAAPSTFERSDFEDYLRASSGEGVAGHAAAKAGGPRRRAVDPDAIDVEPVSVGAEAPPGVVLSPARLAVVAVVLVLLLAGAFAAGIAVDRLILLSPAH